MSSIRKSLLLIAAILHLTITAAPIGEGQACPIVTQIVPNPTITSTITIIETFVPSSIRHPPSALSSVTALATSIPTSITTPFKNTTIITNTTSAPTTVAKLPTSSLPTTGNTLAFVALGRGIQNYTCSAINATPVALGAVAVLYDYTTLASTNETELHTLPSLAVNVPFNPLPLTATPPSLAGLPPATVLGHHYFAADGTVVFNLTGAPVTGGNQVMFGAKTASASAPSGADVGPEGTGAVAWLQIEAKVNNGEEVSVGIQEAYRVETAGGNPLPECSSVGVMTVPYAAEYWYFD